MKNNKSGVSLISLIITITIIVIIATTTIQNGLSRIDEAKLSKHNTNISTTQEDIESFYYYKGGELPVVDLTPYPVSSNATLYAEINKNGEQSDDFYVVDLSKLGKVAGKDGTGVADDIYIVSKTKHNVYYVKGTMVKGLVYHGLGIKNDGGIAQSAIGPTNTPTYTPTTGPTSAPTNSPTPTPGGGLWDGYINSPKLSAGMTAVKWDGNTWVAADATNIGNDWYDYHNTGGTANKWANARLNDGSLLVWIPRYTYQIASGEHSSTAGTINIRFTNGTTDDTSGGYRIHPAFYWGGWNIPISAAMTKVAGGTELTGIWVGKFEASSNDGKVKIIDSVASWRNIYINDAFNACRNVNMDTATYGITTSVDTHLLKNSEWGAVAYLSKYARGATEVSINPNSGFRTANNSIVTNKTQSTTGTEYGIYDMNGCAMDYVAGYVSNGDSNITTFGNSIYIAEAKYKDVFPKAVSESGANNYAAINQAYGFAMYETSSNNAGAFGWFNDFSFMIYGSFPWLTRGSNYNGNLNAVSDAGLFNFHASTGGNSTNVSFRMSAVIE